jgi:hypothetical protein
MDEKKRPEILPFIIRYRYRYICELIFWSYLQGKLHKRWLKPALANIVEPNGEDRKWEKGNSGLLCFLCTQQSQ